MKPYRILSLDGGGTWALVQVMALQKIYSGKTRGHDVLKDFDLVAANSGGAITLGGLVANLPLDEVLGYFGTASQRARIFNPLPFAFEEGARPFRYLWHRFMRRILPIGAKYGTREKLRGLQHVLTESPSVHVTREGKKITAEDYKFWEIPGKIAENTGKSPDFLICAFRYDRRRAKFFRSNSESLSGGSNNKENATLCEAIHASANPPVNYFLDPAKVGDDEYWDGAVAGLNNPVLAAVTEALANGHDPRSIQILSIGTGTVVLPSPNEDTDDAALLMAKHTSTLFGDLAQISTSILDDPPDTATYISHVVLSPKGLKSGGAGLMESPIVRMTPAVRPMLGPEGKWTLPKGFGKTEFEALMKLDLDATTPAEIKLLEKLGKAWIAGDIANQGIREGAKFECQIGHSRFGDAHAHWKKLMALELPDAPAAQSSLA